MSEETDEFARLDRLLDQLRRLLEVPGQEDASAEWTWEKVELLEESMGDEAMRRLLRRQGMAHSAIDEVLEVTAGRRGARP